MKTHMKIRRIISVALISMFSIISLNSYAFAATEIKPETGDATLKVTSQLLLPQLVSVPGVAFDITYSKDGVNNGGTKNTADTTQPDLKNLDTSGGDISYNEFDGTGTDGATGYTAYILKTNNILPAGSDFAHAGEYVYTIKQSSNNNTNFDDYLTYSKAEYELHIFVENVQGGLRVAGCFVKMTKNSSGTTISPVKVDIDETHEVTYRTGAFTFDNYYKPTNEKFIVSNTVVGSFADLSKSYSFTLKLTNPSNATDETPTKYYGVVVDGTTMKPVNTDLIEFVVGTEKKFYMKTGEKLVFVSSDYAPSTSVAVTDVDAKVLPGGLKYNAAFMAFTGYQHKGTVTHGGETEKTVTGELSEALSMTKETYVDDGDNTCAFQSNYREAVITGFTNRILPFVLMMLLAVVSIAVNRRRKAE